MERVILVWISVVVLIQLLIKKYQSTDTHCENTVRSKFLVRHRFFGRKFHFKNLKKWPNFGAGPKFVNPLYYKAVKIFGESSDPQFSISSKITSISSIKHKNLNSNNDLNQSKTIILFDEEGNTKESIVPKMHGTPHPQKLFFDTFAKQRFIAEKNLETSREKPKVARNLFLKKFRKYSLVLVWFRLNLRLERRITRFYFDLKEYSAHFWCF